MFDLRVYNGSTGGEMTIFRIDSNGLSVTSPGRVTYYCNGDMTFRNGGTMTFDSENLVMQGRKVIKNGNAI